MIPRYTHKDMGAIWSEMRRYLEGRVAGKKVRRPAARKLAR